MEKELYLKDPRFRCLEPFAERAWLSSPTMHREEQFYVDQAIETNWVSTIGANINEVERAFARRLGRNHAVALTCGTAALHLATRLCGIKLYGQPATGHGSLEGRKVFCSDMTFDATVNPVAYEGGEAVFIDTERDTWNMDPAALERAFAKYPEVRLVVLAHLYGTPGKAKELREICDRHGALLVEDAAESLGATYQGQETGSFGDVGVISFNGNKIITGSSGGMLLTDSEEEAKTVRKWSTQSRDNAPWYQHSEMGYNYRMSNLIAGVVRGQLPHLEEHIAQKRAVYERYREGLKDLPVQMNPFDAENSVPNFWLSCLLIDADAMCRQERTDFRADYWTAPGKSCPTEILEAMAAFNAEGRPIWKPMHMQPIYRGHDFVSVSGDVSADIFRRGLCLPSDNKLTPDKQDRIIEIIHRCFD
ncbi:MAG: DegT/DnrJ/EryC1/StrS family aminotransferase [Oscillospiraceae bacterium]|nr:DegT/DnrJ/EryC1/StrS family aminotransferase [Oscillospiraceae bacterium]